MTGANGLSFASPADRTHALDAVWMVHLGSVRLGGAFTFTSGAPYTRAQSGSVFERQSPNAQRLPSYQSVDLSIDYTRTIGDASLIGFAGMQNVLGRTNLTWYQFSGDCGRSQISNSARCSGPDVIEAPVRFAPTIGVRLVY
jgi:outer membrane receptor protein involved in Fe transport